MQAWESKIEMNDEAVKETYESFVKCCINDDFVKKFTQEFGSGHYMGARFFKKHKKYSLSDSVSLILRTERFVTLRIDILSGSARYRSAYTLEGHPILFSDFFISERHAIAKIQFLKRSIYLFCESASRAVYAFGECNR